MGEPEWAAPAELGQGNASWRWYCLTKASWMRRSSPGEHEGRRNVPGRGAEVMLRDRKVFRMTGAYAARRPGQRPEEGYSRAR